MKVNETVDHLNRQIEYGNIQSNIQFLNKSGVLRKHNNILEIGSGKGSMLSYLIGEGYSVRGVEMEQEYIENSKILYGDLPIQKVENELLPFPQDSFDVVLSFDVFEHIPDSDNHLREVSRVLKPKGYYLLQTPNKYTNIIFETIRWKSLTKWRSDHCSLHTYNQILRRLHKCDFSVTFVEIPVVNDFFKKKIKFHMGNFGLFLLKIMNPDKLPNNFRTNFYLIAKKNN
jgi:2-polyprenyl-3-methyl-5-hydroxy-6-metoxy-1,4-benzoquinol methylase